MCLLFVAVKLVYFEDFSEYMNFNRSSSLQDLYEIILVGGVVACLLTKMNELMWLRNDSESEKFKYSAKMFNPSFQHFKVWNLCDENDC